MEKTEIQAHAKINLYLDVTGRRADGYHDILSIMHEIPQADVIRCELSDKIRITCSQLQIPVDGRNIAYRCAVRFFEETGIKGGVAIDIEKHIPCEAGMGGGSTDGAAVLRALDALYDTRLTTEKLAEIGAGAGADIPFCVYGGTALCEGIGERITSLPPLSPDYMFCMVQGADRISTAQAYTRIDALKNHTRLSRDELMRDYFAGRLHFYNIFENCIPENSDVNRIKGIFAKYGVKSLMTGSGSAVFGISDDKDRVTAAYRELYGLFPYVSFEA